MRVLKDFSLSTVIFCKLICFAHNGVPVPYHSSMVFAGKTRFSFLLEKIISLKIIFKARESVCGPPSKMTHYTAFDKHTV